MRAGDTIPGVRAGLLSGTFVAIFFFVGDLIHLAPLSTPLALMQKLSLQEIPRGGSASLDQAALSEAASLLSSSGGLVALTALHLLVFALLGVAAIAFFEWCQLPLNAGTGAVWGLVVYSLVFELSMAIASPDVVQGVPSLWSVAGVNLLAGAVLGGYVRLRARGLTKP